MPEPVHQGSLLSDGRLGKFGGLGREMAQERPAEKGVGLTTRESVELFQEAVDTAREEYQRLNSEAATETLKPKLTVDLRTRGLSQLPKEVISIIRHDVERLQLSYNGLSYIAHEFNQCSALKYLNLRGNSFKEIPKAIFDLPQLEILDLSRNKLSEVPDEINCLIALRVFSIQHNNVQDLPLTLATIATLRMLKLTGNPWNRNLQRIIDGSDEPSSPSRSLIKDDNERDTILTKKILDYMRYQAAPRDSGEDSTDDGPLETPRALSRFPVQPQYSHSTSGSESASDLRSPVFARPPLPARSHNRVPSSQYGVLHNAAPRRPGLAPLALGSERNRSNSESILQSAQTNRLKRNGMVSKRQNDLGVLDETRTNRNSHHYRGQSHGSALRNGVRASDSSPSKSPIGGEFQRGMVIRRLASVPEQRRDPRLPNLAIESAKSILYSLDMILPLASTLAGVIKDGKTKRSSVEREFHSAFMHVDHLDQELLRLDSASLGDASFDRQARRAVMQATHDCVVAQQRVNALLIRIAKYIVKECDPRFVRSFMLILYGSMNEMINAGNRLEIGPPTLQAPTPMGSTQRVSTINEIPSEGEYAYMSDRSMTPTQHRKTDRRLRAGDNVQQSLGQAPFSALEVQSAVGLSHSGRSRSNSRVRPFHSSAASSVVNTPRSGESFSSAAFVARSRSGSINTTAEQIRAEKQETTQFEKIFAVLSKSVEEGIGVATPLQTDFFKALDVAERKYASARVRDQWASLANGTIHCLAMSEALKTTLSNIRLNDREARNVRNFWQLIKGFLDSYSNLLLGIKEAMRNNLVDSNLRQQLRPIHQSITEVTRLIAHSPWAGLTHDVDPQATPLAATQLHTQMPAQHAYQHHARGSGGSSTGGTSPYPTNVPATPLSAALGPAAQATVPAPPPSSAGSPPPTPNTASLERSFEGDIFQRAETYQSLQQTMVPRRSNL